MFYVLLAIYSYIVNVISRTAENQNEINSTNIFYIVYI